jgi:sugar lactone lactonase YvrE
LFAGCSGSSNSVQPAAIAQSGPSSKLGPKAPKGDSLYVSEESGPAVVAVYRGSPRKLVRAIGEQSTGMAFDAAGRLYIAGISSVLVYANGGKKLVETISKKLHSPQLVAFDADGNLYVADKNGVAIFLGGKERRIKRIRVKFVQAIALDPQNNLYVASNEHPISVYAEGSTTPFRTISQGVDSPVALTFDSAGNLYVANVFTTGTCGKSSNGGSVSVYAPNGSTPIQTITPADGICNPIAFAFDSGGNLYVANYMAGTYAGSVTVYSPGSLNLLRTITDGVGNPRSLALDSAGKLYVGNMSINQYTGDVTVYAANSTNLIQTMSYSSRAYPIDLVVGK